MFSFSIPARPPRSRIHLKVRPARYTEKVGGVFSIESDSAMSL